MEKEYSFHRICMSAIFLFGNIALFIPYKNAKNGEFSAVLTALAGSVLLYFLWYFLADKTVSLKAEKIYTKIIYIALLVVSFIANTITAKNFADYISNEVLIKSLKISIVCSFAVICIYVVSKRCETLAKFSLLSFFFIVITVLVLFGISSINFEPINAKELFCGGIVKRSLFYFSKALWFPLVYAYFSKLAYKDKNLKNDVIGLTIGSVLVIVCFLSAVLTFSLGFASDIEFAYPISISVVNIGELFTRMDGFAYFIFFFSALIKTSICGFVIKMTLVKLNIKIPYKITVLIMAMSFVLAYLI